MNAKITEAITCQNILQLRYHGFNRTVEPHAYGRDKSGDEILRCYQTEGGSESGERFGWKLLKLSDIYSIHTMDQTFAKRSGYKPNDKAMEYIFSQL